MDAVEQWTVFDMGAAFQACLEAKMYHPAGRGDT